MRALNVGSISVGDHDRDWLTAMAAVTNTSVRAKIASIVAFYVRRRKAEYEAIIAYTARRHGLDFDECFRRLVAGEDLGPLVDDFDVTEPEDL